MNNTSWIWSGKLSLVYAVRRKLRKECGTCFRKAKYSIINQLEFPTGK
jgi:hypothetical protein